MSGLTSTANVSSTGPIYRAAAATAEATIKKGSRFSPCSVNELTSWISNTSGYIYSAQDERHKAMTDSKLRTERAQAYTTLKATMAADFISMAPASIEFLKYYDWELAADDERLPDRYFLERDFSNEGDAASAGGNSTQTLRGVASSFVRTMWTAVIVLGREPHPISAIRPHCKGVVRAAGDNIFKPRKEFGHLAAMTGDAFYADIFMSKAFFAMRALKVAHETKTENVDRDHLCRQVFDARLSSENTIAGFNNNIAAVFGALKKNGAERFKPDATAIAAIRAFMPSADLAWLDTSGQALTYSVFKFLDTFRDDFLTTRRQLRADIAVMRALDRGGLKSKKAASRLPEIDDDGLRDMMRALLKQVWAPVWRSVIQPWLRKLELPAEAQSFLLTTVTAVEKGEVVKFADDKGFTRHDAERVQLLLMLHFSCLRSQVWRDSVVEEYELSKRDGKIFYSLSMTRAFKTAACKEDRHGGLPHLAKWELSETESLLVLTVLTLCRPILSAGTKRTSRIFLDAAGAPVTQRWIESKIMQVGADWLGVPRLGPHTLRTLWISWMVNSGLVGEEDFDSLAAYVQVSRCTMLEAYVCPSHNGPAQRVGKLLRDGGLSANVRTTPAASVSSAESAPCNEETGGTTSEDTASTTESSDTMEVEEGHGAGGKPYGKALGAKRKPYRDNIMLAVKAHGGDAKCAFDTLVTKRKLGHLAPHEQWFREDVTYFCDTDLPAFKKQCTNK
ncbi:hypothetical protein JKP88DRAFT_249613 [Tribonema minus]|uniref:Uncharacterized protein n=1 Tax=Tribonema minus TaxID=303371 RepID=A0A835YIL5_9STRA|nr:hypothetical protein JKP88DRAFT_249613 [Tribonema minus]